MGEQNLDAERALRALEQALRSDPNEPRAAVMSGPIPEDLRTSKLNALSLSGSEQRALMQVRAALAADPRFEHLADAGRLEDVTWRLVCRVHLEGGRVPVDQFIAEHAMVATKRICYFPVEGLAVRKEIALSGVRLLPMDAVGVPAVLPGPDPRPTMTAVMAVECTGSGYASMGRLSRARAEHVLRTLRVALREHRGIHDRQLRFQLGRSEWFDDSKGGWTIGPTQGWELELTDELATFVADQEISNLSEDPVNDLERRLHRALRWFEQAQLAGEQMMKMLYLFFALESILGDTAEGLKAPALAIRRATLGAAVTGQFVHPARAYFLYDQVRSTAVHGEEPAQVEEGLVQRFAWDVRRALTEYLSYARREGFTKRAQVRAALDAHEAGNGLSAPCWTRIRRCGASTSPAWSCPR